MKQIIKILTGIALIVPIFAVLTVFFTVALFASIIQFVFPKAKTLSKLFQFLEYIQELLKNAINKNQLK